MATIVSYTKDEIDALLGVPTFIQTTAPVTPGKYLWWDTSGGNLTLWIEDGE